MTVCSNRLLDRVFVRETLVQRRGSASQVEYGEHDHLGVVNREINRIRKSVHDAPTDTTSHFGEAIRQ